MLAMRAIALISVLSFIGLLGSCQTTYAGNAYRQGRTPVIHGQTPMPTIQQNRYGSEANPLIPTRALSQPATPAPSPKGAEAVCVMDPRTGRILYGYHENERRQVASTQKIITALCVCDAGDIDQLMTIKPEDKRNVAPTRLNDIASGEQYTRRSMLQAMLTGSYNNVAYGLARDVAGSEAAFVDRMNARARRMRMYNSHFVNPHGLPGPQYSTAKDMATAACYAYVNPIIRPMIDAPSFSFILANGRARNMNNTNKLLNKPHLHWVNGMKTGYTNAAGHCLISSGTLHGQAVIVVVLGCKNRTQLWSESEKYLRWAMGV